MKISVIVPTLNSANTIARLINSLNIFSTANLIWELIVVDGESTDATVNIVRSFKCDIKLIIEKDYGIYDAMNKGIKISTGDWLLFIGSDDYLNVRMDLSKLKKSFYKAEINHLNFISFVSIRDYGDSKEKLVPRPYLLPFINSIPHPSTFIRKKEVENGYLLKYEIASDYEFFLRKFISGCKFLKVDSSLVIHSYGGISSNSIKSQGEVRSIQRELLPSAVYFVVQSLIAIKKSIEKIWR